ncbi:FAD-binding oxidoreductase [Legionella pneumophila]|uniref:2Fe-2S iron-sulfur cluster-binding protein n=1 Tax=Legionella pneumophila TaxID=446 RepID=UPI0026DFFE94|nr:2Fe-2S iron-sulfur cluster-binding protein [Legionella pneumophila]MDO5215672.1 FAD-binding oxidoreductase [Legionella pneumophila]
MMEKVNTNYGAKQMPSEKVLPASIPQSEEQDRIEPTRLHATLNNPCTFGYRIAMKGALLILGMMMGIMSPLPLLAEMPPSEHTSHHPGNKGTSTTMPAGTDTNASVLPPISTTPANSAMPPSNMMGPSSATPGPPGCCGMMATGGKPFYPSLMDFPALTDEARKYIRDEAVARLGLGVQTITSIQAELHRALSTNDAVAAQTALRQVRQGLSFAESGASALQALNEAQPPPQIALTWFNREMSLGDNTDNVMDGSFRDISWLHWALMLLLATALMVALLFRWARLRRVSALIQRLTPDGDAAKPINVPKPPESVSSSPKTEHPIQQRWSGVLRTMAIFDETANVKTFRLMEPNLGSIPFTFFPGQYATITSVIHGEKVRRSYTISSSPTQHDYIELTVKREQYGLESRHLHDHINTGDLLEVSAPAGEFFFTGKEANGIVLIAGGVGMTPMMSVLRYLTDRSYPKDIHLLYAVNSPSNIIFHEECTYLVRRHPNVHMDIIALTADETWTGPVGFITPDFIAKAVPDIAQHRIHLCGPAPMMDAVKAALLQLKIPSEQIKTEHFAPPKGGPVYTAEPPKASSALKPSEASTDRTPMPPPSAHATVSFSKSNTSGQLAPDQSVLEAAEALGVFIDFECRVGTCGRCKVPLLEGTVTMEVEDALSEEEKDKGIILACQAKSASSLVVEA